MIRAAFLWILGSLSELCCAVKYHLFFIFFRCGFSSWYVLLFFGFLEVSCSAGSFTLSFTQSLRGGKWFAFNWIPFSCILSYTFYWEENSPSTVNFIPFKFMFLVFFLNLFFWTLWGISSSTFAEPALSRTEYNTTINNKCSIRELSI